MSDKIGQKFVTKHAKWPVSFCFKSNERCKTACFASKRDFAKQQVCFTGNPISERGGLAMNTQKNLVLCR
jgi:hypothetical protein